MSNENIEKKLTLQRDILKQMCLSVMKKYKFDGLYKYHLEGKETKPKKEYVNGREVVPILVLSEVQQLQKEIKVLKLLLFNEGVNDKKYNELYSKIGEKLK